MTTHVSTALLAGVLAGLVACGDDDPIPIDDIPEETRLVDLSATEYDGVCAWASELAKEKFPPGTNCNGVAISYQGCMRPPANCPGTLGQWKVCIPVFFDRIAQDPCVVLDLAFFPEDLAAFVEETPGCATLGPCATAMGMSPAQ
jgi:hypothetical protein